MHFRTQSIVSVSDAVPVACGSKLRRRRNTKEKLHKNNGGAAGDGPSQVRIDITSGFMTWMYRTKHGFNQLVLRPSQHEPIK
jgi:hypothetical protein